MTEQPTICITIPDLRTGCWVFVHPPSDRLPIGRRFTDHGQAATFARDLATETGWRIEDASAPAIRPPFDARQARINEQLWLMTTLLHDDEIGWSDSLRWEEMAREIGGILVDVEDAICESDRGMLLSIGAVLLKRAAAEAGVDSVDDVLGDIMVVDGG